MIKHRFALNTKHQVVDINDLTVGDRTDYICIGCKGALRPVIGKVRKKHFRHKTEDACSIETYLHNLGKLTFENTYRYCLEHKQPFDISFKQYKFCISCPQQGPCAIGTFDTVNHDLTQYFREVQVEQVHQEFIPDIALKHISGETLYIEIAVTHTCTEKKLQSKNRIIEIKLRDEGDVAVIKSKLLNAADERISFYNFKQQYGKFASECTKHIFAIIVYPDGYCSTSKMTWAVYEQTRLESTVYLKSIEWKDNRSFLKGIEQAHLDGAQPKNCNICKYLHWSSFLQVGLSDGKGKIHCSRLLGTHDSNKAVGCKYFCYKPSEVLDEILYGSAVTNGETQ